jgi:hypothetical protein
LVCIDSMDKGSIHIETTPMRSANKNHLASIPSVSEPNFSCEMKVEALQKSDSSTALPAIVASHTETRSRLRHHDNSAEVGRRLGSPKKPSASEHSASTKPKSTQSTNIATSSRADDCFILATEELAAAVGPMVTVPCCPMLVSQ